MIILDTNVISETARPNPDKTVIAYLDSLDRTTTYLTAITASELLRGVDLMPRGKRKSQLENDVFSLFEHHFKDRILPFDFNAASRQAIESSRAQKIGKAVSLADSMIAGIALDKSAVVATRDTAPFEAMGVTTINPWEWSPKKGSDWGIDEE